MVGRGILLGVEVNEAEVEGDDPLEWVKVKSPFEAGNRCNILLLSEEAHSNVVPELARVGIMYSCDTVFEERSIVVTLILDD